MAQLPGNIAKPFKYTALGRIVEFLRLLFVMTAFNARGEGSNPLMGIIKRFIAMATLIFVFFLMMSLTGLRNLSGRIDLLLNIVIGITLFMTHIFSFMEARGLKGNSALSLHAPITPLLELFSGACAFLYQNVVSILLIFLVLHCWRGPLVIEDVRGLMNAYFWAWLSGLSIGSVIAGMSPFVPIIPAVATPLFRRLNMLFSGKMFTANSLPTFMLPFFLWNPLFHIIDQARGAVFRNYDPIHTNMVYPMWFTFTAFTIGFLLMFASKKVVSASWGTR